MSFDFAKEIMGQSILSAREATRYWGLDPGSFDNGSFAGIPFHYDLLDSVRDTHLLHPFPGISIMNMMEQRPDQFHAFEFEGDWYKKHRFARFLGSQKWLLVRKEVITESLGVKWDTQIGLIPEEEHPVDSCHLVYVAIGHFLATGERILGRHYARCKDQTNSGNNVLVGHYDEKGIAFADWTYDGNYSNVGICTKF